MAIRTKFLAIGKGICTGGTCACTGAAVLLYVCDDEEDWGGVDGVGEYLPYMLGAGGAVVRPWLLLFAVVVVVLPLWRV